VRAVLALMVFGWVAIASNSCVSTLDLDDYGAATEELCELLDRCFGVEHQLRHVPALFARTLAGKDF